MKEDDLITLGTYPDEIQAEMDRARLEAHDIPAIVSREATYFTTARLMIRQGHEEAAIKILKSADAVPIPEEEGA